jgi:hypothetical protein
MYLPRPFRHSQGNRPAIEHPPTGVDVADH